MNESVSPVVPLLPTVVGVGALALWAALLVIAVLTLGRAERLSVAGPVLWCLAIIALPLLGCLAWLAYYGLNRASLRSMKT